MTATIVQPTSSTDTSRPGRGLDVLLSGDSTAGALAVVACEIAPAVAGPPLHVHPDSDETFLVYEGTLLLQLGDELVRVPAGGLVHVPRGLPHTFATSPGEGARFFAVHTPGGFERFHVAAAEAEQAGGGGPLSPPELIRIAEDFDWQLAGPPLLPNGQLAGARP